jgi:glycosyltransferase involved in cell wall biosynthesis
VVITFLCGSADLYGAGRVLLQDVRVLARQGVEVRVVLPFGGPLAERLSEEGAQVVIHELVVLRRVNRRRDLRLPARLPEVARSADLVVIWTLALSTYLPLLRTRGKAVLVSVHELLPDRTGRLLARFAAAQADWLMANSWATWQWLVDNGASPESISVAYPAAPPVEHVPLSAGSDRVSVLLAGRVNERKGHVEAVQAVRQVRDRGVPVDLVLAGGPFPGQEAALNALLANIAGLEWVDYVGEHDSIGPLLERADLLLLATQQPEPFGMVLLEAWASGRRGLAPNEGGALEAAFLTDAVAYQARDLDSMADAIFTATTTASIRGAPNPLAPAKTLCTLDRRAAQWRAALRGLGGA